MASDSLESHMTEVQRLVALARMASLTDEAGVELVHDVRVALRRCRSLAQGLVNVDVAERRLWRTLSRTGRPLFAALGTLRDAQVMRGFVADLVDGDTRVRALAAIDDTIAAHVGGAVQAIAAFDDVAWAGLSTTAPARAALMLRKRPALLWLALVRFGEARALHVHAMRVRSSEALHDVRIGVKRLRYTLESLLPEQHSTVSKLLKKLQDVLGDLHDLDVATAFLHSLPDTNDADLARLVDKRAALLASYKAMATGRAAVWNTLRAVLPTRTDAIARCQRAALIELACAYGADSRSIRRGEAIARAIAKATNTTLDDAQRAAVVLVAAKKPRRRARQMLGASPEQIKAVRRALKSNVVKAVAAAAAR